MTELRKVSIVGLGKLGAPMAAAIASKGLEVIGVDLDLQKVEAINRLEPPVYEPGLSEMLQKAGGRIRATTDLRQAVLETEATFVVVATPSQPDGHFSLEYVLTACQTIGEALRDKSDWHLVVITSTVSPLSMDHHIQPHLEKVSGKKAGRDFGLAYNPEFIALGTVIRDFLNPDLILIGESDKKTGDLLVSFYQRVLDNEPAYARMNFVNAELTKLSINTYVTTKISFANMLARICERLPGADVDTVTAALGKDSRIGHKYLKGAISYGGPCFPRDNLALIAIAREVGVVADVAETTDRFNRNLHQWLADYVALQAQPGQKVGILGFAYKPGTDVITEAPGLYLAKYLQERGYIVIGYDPAAQSNAQAFLGDAILWSDSAENCIRESDVVVLLTPWPQFKAIPSAVWESPEAPKKVIDCWRYMPELAGLQLKYIPLGQGRESAPIPASL